MKMRHWISESGWFSAIISTQVIAELQTLCHAQPDRETGGVLVGNYSNDLKVAFINRVVPPPTDSQSGSTWFVRGSNGLATMLSKFWKAKERQFYLGEWHYHPSKNVTPSSDDLRQMQAIGRNSKYQCQDPILLIIGKDKDLRSPPISVTVCPMDGMVLALVEKTTPIQ